MATKAAEEMAVMAPEMAADSEYGIDVISGLPIVDLQEILQSANVDLSGLTTCESLAGERLVFLGYEKSNDSKYAKATDGSDAFYDIWNVRRFPEPGAVTPPVLKLAVSGVLKSQLDSVLNGLETNGVQFQPFAAKLAAKMAKEGEYYVLAPINS